MHTISDALRRNATITPGATCLVDSGHRLTFGQVEDRVNRAANELARRGCRPGDTVAVYARNCAAYIELMHVGARLGVTVVTLNHWLRDTEVADLLSHCGATWVVVTDETAEAGARAAARCASAIRLVSFDPRPSVEAITWDELVDGADPTPVTEPADADRPFWMMYTSGTTGRPKAVVRSMARTMYCLWFGVMEFGFRPQDRFLALSPLFHGVAFLPLMVLQVGGSVHVHREFEPNRVLETILQERITSSFMVPTMLDMLAAEPRFRELGDAPLRVVVTGAAPSTSDLRERLLGTMGHALHEFYGATESGFITVLPPEALRTRPGSCGRPAVGAEVQIRDEAGELLPPGQIGEVFSRCDGRFDGYLDDPDATAQALRDGWFTAEDLGFVDEDGYLYLVDRKKDMIISGGENIYPREIESCLAEHPAVAEVAVIGVPDERWGERVKAVVVPHSDADLTAEELREHCSTHLAGFKVPREVTFAQELPRNASGKLMKRLLR